MRVAVWAGNAFRTLYSTSQSQCHPQHRLAGSLDPAALKTQAQYKSNNHLTGGSARPTVDKRGSDAKLGFPGVLRGVGYDGVDASGQKSVRSQMTNVRGQTLASNVQEGVRQWLVETGGGGCGFRAAPAHSSAQGGPLGEEGPAQPCPL